MTKPNLVRSKFLPYHVTLRANNRDPFYGDLARVWDACLHRLGEIVLLCGARIHSFVLMPNHLHLMISTPDEDLGECMRMFVRNLTIDLNRLEGRSGRVFGAPYYWKIIESDRYFYVAYKYVYRNPVEAKLCQSIESYPFSTIQALLGREQIGFPLWYPNDAVGMELCPGESELVLSWLNRAFPKDDAAAIRKSLRSREFDLNRDPFLFKRDRIPFEKERIPH